jgi:hypothetical protein
MKNTILIMFVVILALVAVVLYKGAESLPKPFEQKDEVVVVEKKPDTKEDTDIENQDREVFSCEPEQREADACIQIFAPVCAEINVQCITTPCPPVKETYSNSCEACKNSLIDVYTEGECVAE